MNTKTVRMSWRRLSMAVCLSVVSMAQVGQSAPFRDGDRVVFFGDSITHGGLYGEYVNLFYATRYPERSIWFSNSGWSGASAQQGLWSIEEDIVAKKPTVVTVMFGMNDISRDAWPRTNDTPALAARRESAIRAYDEKMSKLVSRVRAEAGNPEIVYFTPSPYDQTCLVDGKPSDIVCNDGLAILADHVRSWAARDKATCVDLQKSMLAINAAMQDKDPSASLVRRSPTSFDRVHPGPLGHAVMLYEILKAQEAEGLVDEIERDAKGADSFAFSCTERALPFPMTKEMRGALALVPFERDFNREILRVRNLKKGRYAVKIDGTEVGSWTAAELAEGVNLALNEKTPQYRQAAEAAEICKRLWDGERMLRNFATRRRWMRMHYKLDPDAPGAVEGLLEKLLAEGKGENSYGVRTYRSYLKNWPSRAEFEANVVKDRAALAESVRPREHRFEFAMPATTTFCNPLSIPDMPIGVICRDARNGDPIAAKGWRHDFWMRSSCKFTQVHQYRELADPVVFAEGDTWYLYSSVGLMWTSEDFGGTWRHVPVQEEASYAPAVAKFRGKYYLCTSGGPLSVADSPVGPFRTLGAFDIESFSSDPQMPHTQDPALFVDGDRLYLYWGCCAKPKSIWGVELDPSNPRRAKTPGSAVCLVEFDQEKYPWLSMLIEGAWVFKRDGTYYLTYATHVTEEPRYCWCAMKGTDPLGPFVPQKRNPFFMTETGLVTGTGHGSIWCDRNGDWWINSCVAVAAYNGVERLLAQDRLLFEPNGDIAVGKATETPQWLPSSGKTGDTGWKAIPLTSARPEATDTSVKTWSAVEGLPSKTVFEFPGERTIRAFRVIWRDIGLDTNRGVMPGPYRYRVDYRSNGEWWTWLDASKNDIDLLVDYREAPEAVADAVRLVVLAAPPGITPGLVEFTVFGDPQHPVGH